MADNYTHFSQGLEVTDEEKKWLLEEVISGEDKFDWADDHEAEAEIAKDDFCEKYGLEDVSEWPDFSCSVKGMTVYFYSEESGNPDNVAALMKQFLAKFRPDDAFCMQVAYTRSKPRPGEFIGSCVFVTKNSIEWANTERWELGKWGAFREESKDSAVRKMMLTTLMNELSNQSEWRFEGRHVILARVANDTLEVELGGEGVAAAESMVLEIKCSVKKQ